MTGPIPTPISPPIAFPPNGAPLGNTNPNANAPISPVSRSGTFPHKTSPAVATQTPLIDTTTPAINSVPVELDGVATSPEDLVRRRTGESVVGNAREEEDVLGGGGDGAAEVLDEGRERRAAILASRSNDPSVIVDVPQEPTAEEVEAAKSADGMVTPGLAVGDGLPETRFDGTR